MERDSDTIETIETVSTKEVLNQDKIEVDEKKLSPSNKKSDDAVDIQKNGNLKTSGLSADDKAEFCEVDLEEIDPFTNKVELSKCQLLQVIICSVTLAPIRVICCATLLLLMWVLARIGLLCLNDEKLQSTPHTGWRKGIKKILYGIGKSVIFCVGFHNVNIIGEKCSYEDAPLLIAVPHSTIMDIIGIVYSSSVPVAKESVKNIPIIGVIGRFLQVIFVSRDSKDSRKIVGDAINTRAEMKTRRKSLLKRSSQRIRSSLSKSASVGSAKSVKEKNDCDEEIASWPQTIIFPEGTVTNGKAVLKFKSGAFYPGVAIQPMLLRPRAIKDSSVTSGFRVVGLDTLTWTMYQNWSPITCMWLTLCQFNSHWTIEYLPLYSPNQQERRDPKLFASNVRITVAEHLSAPLANVTLEDRFYKKKDFNKSMEENLESRNKDSEKEIELLETTEITNKNNNKQENDAATVTSNKASDSPLLSSSSNPTMDFSGTINYI